MQSFNHDPIYNPDDTYPYLHNPVIGGTTFYHVNKGEGCKFDKSMLSFFGLTKGYVQQFFSIHPDSHHDSSISTPNEVSPYFTICEVRFRNLRWDNIFDVANYIKSLDDSILNADIDDEEARGSYPYNFNQDRGEMHPVELTRKGAEIEEYTGFPIEGYSFTYFLNFRKLKGRQLIAALNEQGFGRFYGFLEDESTSKQPLCDDDDYECMGDLSSMFDDSDSPLTLALDFRLGKQIIVELIRYEVVDKNGRIVYRENLEDRAFGTEARKFYPGRQNPALSVESGYLVNPETGDTYWFHGSWTGRKRKFDWKSPRRHAYGATYFTSSEELAADFATGERAWLNFDEEPPPMKRTGYMHRVQIKDVPLVDSDNLFVDKEALALSEEGVAFVQALQQFGASDTDIESFIRTLSGGTYHAFSKQDNSIWPSLIRTIEHLGYRGWFERESVHRSHTNIGLLEPDEDARIRGGYTVKRTRRF